MEQRNGTGTNQLVGSNMTVEVVPPDEVEAEESTPGVVRKTLFETENAVVVQSHIEGGRRRVGTTTVIATCTDTSSKVPEQSNTGRTATKPANAVPGSTSTSLLGPYTAT